MFIITNYSFLCLTVQRRLTDVYPLISLVCRIRLMIPRLRLASRRRKAAARLGLVLWRVRGVRLACLISSLSRSMAARRFCSCVRCWRASMIKTPSDVMRLPASLASRCLISSGMEAELFTLNRNCTAVDSLLTFCPPGPVE